MEDEIIGHASNQALLSELNKRIKSGVCDEDAEEIMLDTIKSKDWMVWPDDQKEKELSDFEFDEIIEYLGEQVDDIEPSDFDELLRLLEAVNSGPIIISNLNDKMKFEHICKVFEKYTLEQLETLIPE